MGSARHVGGIATSKVAIRPNNYADTSAAFVTTGSVIIDRQDYSSGLLAVHVGAATGSPSAIAVDAKITEADDAAMASPSDVSGGAITTIAAANTSAFIDIGSLDARKRYLRVAYKVTLTAGTTPAVGVGAVLVLGGKVNSKPVHA